MSLLQLLELFIKTIVIGIGAVVSIWLVMFVTLTIKYVIKEVKEDDRGIEEVSRKTRKARTNKHNIEKED